MLQGFRMFRNRLIGDEQFRRWSARLPLTRTIARSHANTLFDHVTGFVYSQILFACVQTNLVAHLAAQPLWVSDFARLADLPDEGALRLLRAAAALGLAEQIPDGRFMLGPQGAALHASPGIAAMVAHHRLLYADLADPVALLRNRSGGHLAEHWSYGRGDPEAYSALMAASQAMVAEQILGAWSFRGVGRLLDVGGGSGTFARAVMTAHPRIEAAVFDLPDVTDSVGDGVRSHGGDFFNDPLPGGYDTLSLVRILHDHDDAPAMALLEKIATALPAKGRLIIAEPMAATAGAVAMGDAYFGMYLWAMGSGRPRSAVEITQMLRAAGFARIRQRATDLPLITSVLVACL